LGTVLAIAMPTQEENELFLLLECAESPFGLGFAEDFRWHVEHPGESQTADLVAALERRGQLRVVNDSDPHSRDGQVAAELTERGRERIQELVKDGVTPAPGWL
jgi:hypothetical protein